MAFAHVEIILLYNETQQAAHYSFYHNLLGRNVSNTLHMCEYNISILKCFEHCNTSDTWVTEWGKKQKKRKKAFTYLSSYLKSVPFLYVADNGILWSDGWHYLHTAYEVNFQTTGSLITPPNLLACSLGTSLKESRQECGTAPTKNRLKVSQLYNKVLGFSKHISTHRKSPSIWRAGVLQGCNAGKRAQKPTASEGIRDSHSRFASSVGMRAPGTCSRCPGSLPAWARPPPPAAPGKRRRLSGSVPDRERATASPGHLRQAELGYRVPVLPNRTTSPFYTLGNYSS